MAIEQDTYWAVGECCLRKEGAPDVFGVAVSISGTTISLDPASAKQMASMLLLTADKVEKEFERDQPTRKAKEATNV